MNTSDALDFFTDPKNPRINIDQEIFSRMSESEPKREFLKFSIQINAGAVKNEAVRRTEERIQSITINLG